MGTLLHSGIVASGSATNSTSGQPARVSLSGGIPFAVAAGSTLVVVLFVRSTVQRGGGAQASCSGSLVNPAPNGLAWNPNAGGSSFQYVPQGGPNTTNTGGFVQIFVMQGASPALSNGTPISATAISNYEGLGYTGLSVDAELHVYEFGGVGYVGVGGAGFTPNLSAWSDGSGGTPSDTFYGGSTSASCLMLDALVANAYTIYGTDAPCTAMAAPSGFTLGLSTSLVKIGQFAYQFDTPAGYTGTTWGGTEPTTVGGSANWATGGRGILGGTAPVIILPSGGCGACVEPPFLNVIHGFSDLPNSVLMS